MPVPDIDGIACLPVELWAAVLAALPIPERARISGVSHRLAAASLLALAMPFTLDFRGIKCEKKIKKMVSGHTKKRATGIVILGARDDIVASVVGFHLSTLKRLEIIGWNTLSDHALVPFLSEPQAKYPLRVLRLENPGVYCAISSRSIIAISQTCTNLVSFSVWCGANIDFSSLLTLAQSCPLQSLKVDKTHGAFPHLLADLLRSADELETLWLVPRRTPSLPPIQANLTQLLLRTCSFVPRSLFRNGGKLLLLSAAEDAVQLKEGWIACPTNEMKERVRSLYEMCGIKEDKFRETRMWYAV